MDRKFAHPYEFQEVGFSNSGHVGQACRMEGSLRKMENFKMTWNQSVRQDPIVTNARQIQINRMKEMEQAASIAVSIELALQAEEKTRTNSIHRIQPGSAWVVMGRHSMTNRWHN
jgi:hypothetical protein